MMNFPCNPPLPYFQALKASNASLGGARYFDFYPGMLFGSRIKWWPDSGMRPTRHEGIDICYYADANGEEQQFTAGIQIPVMASGDIFGICRDFLGQSVFIEHGVVGPSRLLSVYAHIVPLQHLQAGRKMDVGEIAGTVADTTNRKNRMPAHVHISVLKIPLTVSFAVVNWDFICHSDSVELIDPLSLISLEMVRIHRHSPLSRR